MTDESLRGRLLVATPTLVDPNFDRTVVLLLEHGPDGALGVVLNRPGSAAVDELLPEWAGLVAPPAVVCSGGPVAEGTAIGLVRADTEVEGVTALFGDLGTADLADPPPDAVTVVRVFSGYAGWGPGQLEGEIADGAWFVVDREPDDVHGPDPAGLWTAVLRRQPGRLAIFALCPADPSTN